MEGVPALPGDADRSPDELLTEADAIADLREFPRKIELIEQALARISREDDPTLWAHALVLLGIGLDECPTGNRAENLERAIASYQAALEVYTRDALDRKSVV